MKGNANGNYRRKPMAKIIRFNPIAQGDSKDSYTKFNILPTRHQPWGLCRHLSLEINEEARTVICKNCGCEIDPFNALLEFADKERKDIRQMAQWLAAKKEFERIQAEWSLTITEKRRIRKAMEDNRLIHAELDLINNSLRGKE